MKVHYLQHVPFEGVGSITSWAEARGHTLGGTMLFSEQVGAERLPSPDDVDMLVVMGGPMSVYETDKYPWLVAEKAFIRTCITEGKAVLGICLGAQLIADVLGGEVTQGPHEEIGWYPVVFTVAGRQLEAFADFPDRFTALHWHGDTFSIPEGAVHAASSDACPHQAFAFDGARVIGLQFHLEETPETLAELVEAAGRDLPDASFVGGGARRGPWTSSRLSLLAPDAPFGACRDMLFGLLDRMLIR